MTDREIEDLMLDCGLSPIEKHEWAGDHFVNSDSFIEGDYVALMQFAKELIRIERKTLLDTIDEFYGAERDRNYMFSDGYDYALVQIKEYIEGKEWPIF